LYLPKKKKTCLVFFYKAKSHRSYKSKPVNHKEKPEKLLAFERFLFVCKKQITKISRSKKTDLFLESLCFAFLLDQTKF
jgi:hypothetical protein